ncbi:MAG: hypothetical protein C5B55_05560 [Blastocatellia bacterium]|nr:MAG: hypothetical protein C5B55_05560 [Blastocatellia bacterium]
MSVLTAFLIAFISVSCQPTRDVQAVPSKTQIDKNRSTAYGPPVRVGTLQDPAVDESSGIVASRTQPGLYWTHNDSGDGPFLYSFDQSGKSRGVWRVAGATNVDWEDISSGPGPQAGKPYLYIGDIGDNDSVRKEISVYRVAEPTFGSTSVASTKKTALVTEPAEVIRLRYPDGSHDAETLLVHPTTGNLYIVIKVVLANPTIYEATAPFDTGKVTTLKRVGDLPIPSLFGGVLTGGDISPDGTRVAFCDYFQGYELVLPDASRSFDEIWKQKMLTIDLGKRKQGEGIAYRLDGRALITTSEGSLSPLIEVVRK